MGLDYISSVGLNDILNDKTTGQNLAGGLLYFYEDDNRTTPKAVFEQVNIGGITPSNPPLYDYVALPNPLVLSGTGTIMDANGNQVALYYYPYDADGNVQLYYVACFNYLGEPQFTREGWPYSFESDNPVNEGENIVANQISNGQFASVLFDPTIGMTINVTGSGVSTYQIAPDWSLQVSNTSTGTVGVTRNSITGSALLPTNPPYTLTITPGGAITALYLIQTLPNTPALWSPQVSGTNGYIASNFILGSGSMATMIYTPSTGAPTTLLTGTNSTASYEAFSATVEIPSSTNTSTADTGYVNIEIQLSATEPTSISSIQVAGLSVGQEIIPYQQQTANRNIDQLFNYYKPRLDFKPTASYLVGWDFPLNPAQFLGYNVAAQALGTNTSYYAWDQTILFQSATSGITVSQDTTGALKTLSAASSGTQLALIQYLPASIAIEMLSRRKSVNISANASVATNATISLWYLKGTSTLPSTIVSNASIVATLDANGYPATLNTPSSGTWVQVPRSGLNNNSTTSGSTNAAQFSIKTAPTGASSFNQYGFQGWDMQGNTDINNATYFAIVVGTAALAQNAYILWQSISCVDGDIPTVPATKSKGAALQDCQQFYQKSFPQSTVPAYLAGASGCTLGAIECIIQNSAVYGYGVPVVFPVNMTAIPAVKFWSLKSSNGTWTNLQSGASVSYTDSGTATVTAPTLSGTSTLSANGMTIFNPQVSGDVGGATMAIHYTLDNRLGQ